MRPPVVQGATSRSTYLATTSTSSCTGSPGRRRPRVVTSRVWGTRATANQPGPTPATVRLTPSTAIDPFSTTYRSRSAGSSILTSSPSPTAVRSSTLATPSTWPWTRWPPRRPPRAMGRSRLTRSPAARPPRAVRRRVSATRSAANPAAVASATVRQQPLTATDSPSRSSPARNGASTSSRAPLASSAAARAATVPVPSTIPVNISPSSLARSIGGRRRPAGRRRGGRPRPAAAGGRRPGWPRPAPPSSPGAPAPPMASGARYQTSRSASPAAHRLAWSRGPPSTSSSSTPRSPSARARSCRSTPRRAPPRPPTVPAGTPAPRRRRPSRRRRRPPGRRGGGDQGLGLPVEQVAAGADPAGGVDQHPQGLAPAEAGQADGEPGVVGQGGAGPHGRPRRPRPAAGARPTGRPAR